ncbi:MAG: hypothetical protein AAF399_11970 [Bacteroidota bacterium]
MNTSYRLQKGSLGCLSLLVVGLLACHPNSRLVENIAPGKDPNFTIVAHRDAGFRKTNRKVEVFGIPIYAYAEVEDEKLLHAANIMAQYLDNDEDGEVDHPFLLETLLAHDAALFMWKTENQIRLNAQDLGADETVPEWHQNGQQGRFDASLEEVWHVITHSGYAKAFPEVFGEEPGTAIAEAMDIARGGQFLSIPEPYPDDAWYSYDDKTCDYGCMVTEYHYWALTSLLGGQAMREAEISQEWRLHTPDVLQQKDSAVVALLRNPTYRFPTVLPDGKYRP